MAGILNFLGNLFSGATEQEVRVQCFFVLGNVGMVWLVWGQLGANDAHGWCFFKYETAHHLSWGSIDEPLDVPQWYDTDRWAFSDQEEDSDGPPSPKPAAPPTKPGHVQPLPWKTAASWQPGAAVRIVNLQPHLHLNGQVARVVRQDPEKGKWVVRLEKDAKEAA